jgi:tetratricopeptide (TPR) repeat protein
MTTFGPVRPAGTRVLKVQVMFRVSSLATASDAQLNRLIKRVGLLLIVVVIAFVGFYVLDRWTLPQPTIVNREMAALEEAVRVDPADVGSRGRLADVYAGAGRYEDAIVQYGMILETGEADKPAYLGRARAHEESGNLAAAAADFAKVVEIAKGGEMAHVDLQLQAAYYGLGSVALADGRPKDAVTHLTAALAINRADADSLHLIGRAYTANGEPAKGIDSLRRAVSFVPIGWSDPYVSLSEAYASAGDTALATWAGAMAEFVRGDSDGARAALEPLVGGPAGVDASIGLGLIAETTGDTAAAAEWYRTALEAQPDNAAAGLGLKRVAGDPAGATPLPALPVPGELGGNG